MFPPQLLRCCYHYCHYCVYLDLVGSSGHFIKSKLHPATSGLQNLSYNFCNSKQCCFLHNPYATLYIYLLQPVFQSFRCLSQGSSYNWNNRNWTEVPDLFHFPSQFAVNVYLFLFFQLNPFVPRHSNINKVTSSFNFLQKNYVRPLVLKDMVSLYTNSPQDFDPVIFNYTCRFVIISLNLAN